MQRLTKLRLCASTGRHGFCRRQRAPLRRRQTEDAMNLEELARQAGMERDFSTWYTGDEDNGVSDDALARFAALVLEEAAKTAENTPTCLLPSGAFLSERCAAAIRALKPVAS